MQLLYAVKLDQAVKAVSKRLFVTYHPDYRDLRGELYAAECRLWLADPDAPDVKTLVATPTGGLAPTPIEDGLMLTPERQQALKTCLREFRYEESGPYLDASVVGDADLAWVRVDTLDSEDVAEEAVAAGAREARRAAAQDFSDQLNPHALAYAWAEQLVANAAPRRFGSLMGNQARHHTDRMLEPDTVAAMLPEGFAQTYADNTLLIPQYSYGGRWPRFVRAVIGGAEMRIIKDADGWSVSVDLDKLAEWCGLADAMHHRGWYCRAGAREVEYWQGGEA